MFELLTDGTVESLCRRLSQAGVRYGFGGVARLGRGDLPAERIVAEHVRLGSSMAILSRAFCDLREHEATLSAMDAGFFEANRQQVVDVVAEIAARKGPHLSAKVRPVQAISAGVPA
ncbi:hypothetical protein [Tessaracoccus flavus]|uniref:Uncharacterized protein n=1 Tax=Tessaracoccus flavus TaxID=1610493 RepID=A0A1Q2CI28_9ACTN|nr:hypothetical protein [Tessaracoccus flavus]AQP45767.1 hypothetical protein RPIT_13930 [Tessaracoccus flavus]SDZ11785.1 hypothetical protein SAMN05428934_11113 [Tessaracoccus flavus]